MSETTFRDFAAAIMGNDSTRAAEVLSDLMGIDAQTAQAATTHFQSSMKVDPSFMMKAMGLRTAVTSGTDAEIGALLNDCFGLVDHKAAVASLRKHYPAPS